MNVWFTSDHHFSHANFITKFKQEDGSPARPFKTVEEMDEVMIANWNSVVGQYDKIYHLGDVCFNLTRYHSIMPRLNGKKRLILGNHDKFNMGDYMKHFGEIKESWQPLRNVLFSHRPVLLGEEDHHKKIVLNVHGHTHQHVIKDKRYLNICVEQTNYTPIHFSEIEKIFKERGYKLG